MAEGVAIVRALLVADTALVELAPPPQVVAGVLPLNTPLPALAITRVSSVDRNIPAPGATRHVDERVQVTAFAANYPGLRALLDAVKAAVADFIGTAAGLDDVTVHTDSGGPDFMDEQASIHMGSVDFSVGYTESR
jgi:hypothetical protein